MFKRSSTIGMCTMAMKRIHLIMSICCDYAHGLSGGGGVTENVIIIRDIDDMAATIWLAVNHLVWVGIDTLR